jgi:hypothetical protein
LKGARAEHSLGEGGGGRDGDDAENDLAARDRARRRAPREHCRFDGTTYVNPDADMQSVGRNVLAARGAVVLLPREPLVKGVSYAASLTADGATLAWTFTVDCP